MKCKHCGAEIPDDSLFCEQCGKQLVEGAAAPTSPKKLWVIIGVAAVAILVLLILLLIPKNNNSDRNEVSKLAASTQLNDSDSSGTHQTNPLPSETQTVPIEEKKDVQPESNTQAKEQFEAIYAAAHNGADGGTDGHAYVDLGLPSGTLWAMCNVGASVPEGLGNYYAWGETQPKSNYSWETYKFGDAYALTKYCTDDILGKDGFVDNLVTLQRSDDAATANWGGGWYTPSMEQWDELAKYTTSKWVTLNGVKGRLFTSKKNGQTLFLPAAGYRNGKKITKGHCYYMSGTLTDFNISKAEHLGIYSFNDGNDYGAFDDRSDGYSVRPVHKKQ